MPVDRVDREQLNSLNESSSKRVSVEHEETSTTQIISMVKPCQFLAKNNNDACHLSVTTTGSSSASGERRKTMMHHNEHVNNVLHGTAMKSLKVSQSKVSSSLLKTCKSKLLSSSIESQSATPPKLSNLKVKVKVPTKNTKTIKGNSTTRQTKKRAGRSVQYINSISIN
jgi:hypothetical protein